MFIKIELLFELNNFLKINRLGLKVDDKTPEKEIEEIENTVKGILGKNKNSRKKNTSQEDAKIGSEISELESMVKGALTELTDLESNLIDVISPSPELTGKKESNFLMAVRRFQNAMKVALIDGAQKRNFETFQEGFNFYHNALEILESTGNKAEVDQLKSEFSKRLMSIISKEENRKDPKFIPFLQKSCIKLAKIYESFGQFDAGIKFHDKNIQLFKSQPLQGDLERLQIFLDYLLLNNISRAKEYLPHIQFKPIKQIAKHILDLLINKDFSTIEKVKTRIEVLGAQKGLAINNTLALLERLSEQYGGNAQTSATEQIQIPENAQNLSNEKIDAIKSSLSKGIEQLKESHPDLKISAEIDTKSIVSELKSAISSEISKEIKTLSNSIVSQILKKMPAAPASNTSAPAPRSAGNISDDAAPEIDVVEGGEREKPKRPKLDDMLDNVIVSE